MICNLVQYNVIRCCGLCVILKDYLTCIWILLVYFACFSARAGMMWDFMVHVRYQHQTLMLWPTMASYLPTTTFSHFVLHHVLLFLLDAIPYATVCIRVLHGTSFPVLLPSQSREAWSRSRPVPVNIGPIPIPIPRSVAEHIRVFPDEVPLL